MTDIAEATGDTTDSAQVRTVYLAAAASAAGLLAAPAVATAWDQPSALAKWPVSGLAGHVLAQFLVPGEVLDADASTQPPLSLEEHYVSTAERDADLEGPSNLAARRHGAELAAGGPRKVAERAAAELGRLRERLAIDPPVRVVFLSWRGWSLTFEDFLVTRTIELAVHSDDLAVSAGIPTPQLPAPVLDVVLHALVRVAARRHGEVPVLRALSRTERAPGDISAFS